MRHFVLLQLPTSTWAKREENSIAEISPAILFIAECYRGLPKAKIVRIHENRVKLENLYKFRYLKGYEDKDKDENITVKNIQIKIKKVINMLCNFGNTIDI